MTGTEKYCTRCGTKLQEVWRSPKPLFFSPRNGEPVYSVRLRCPNSKGFFNSHTDNGYLWYDSSKWYITPD